MPASLERGFGLVQADQHQWGIGREVRGAAPVSPRRRRRDGMCDASNTDCESSIRRFVWDGDQMLYEIRTPGASTVSATQLESDQPTGERYGVVAYTHAGGIDAPLGIVRMGHPAAIAALIVPHANYRGGRSWFPSCAAKLPRGLLASHFASVKSRGMKASRRWFRIFTTTLPTIARVCTMLPKR